MKKVDHLTDAICSVDKAIKLLNSAEPIDPEEYELTKTLLEQVKSFRGQSIMLRVANSRKKG